MSATSIARLAVRLGVPQANLVGATVAAAVCTGILAPRASWLALLLVVGLIALARPTLASIGRELRLSWTALFLVAFALWALASSVWAVHPLDAAEKSLTMLGVILATHAAVSLATTLEEDVASAFAGGVLIGMIGAGAVLVVEIWTDQSFGRFLVWVTGSFGEGDKHVTFADGRVRIDDAHINRRVCIWMLLFWPAAAAIRNLPVDRFSLATAFVLGAEAALVAVATGHQSSQLALLCGLVVFAAHLMRPSLARGLTLWGWAFAVLLVVPLALAAYQGGLSRAPWLFHSARERVALWGYTALAIPQHPFAGLGANATPAMDRAAAAAWKSDSDPKPIDRYRAARPGRHSHNVYLQAWYELGLVGALLLLAAGIAGIDAIWRRSGQNRGYMLAGTACMAAMVATSFGLWQFWLHAGLGLAAVFMAVMGPYGQES